MIIHPTSISDCYLIEPNVIEDHRGRFFESFNKAALEKALNRPLDFVQDNHSVSRKGVLRGLHFQEGAHAQAKLVRVVAGEILDVVVDLRKDSPTYARHLRIRLAADRVQMLYLPRGTAHGSVSLKEDTAFLYKCDNYYHKEAEGGIRFDDEHLNIDWEYPVEDLILSDKDRRLPGFKEWEKC